LSRVEPGQTVFEVGAGSGWNAALMAQLVGPTGAVYSAEIVPELAHRAADTIRAAEITNVHAILADGGEGHAGGGPYDRFVFTAGTYDLPRPFYDQVKPHGAAARRPQE
jgi:protein-L-isoaspartate(D-aspartate) O-methyltransferase